MLPKTIAEILNGGVYIQQVRCSKHNCKCARGHLHIAYYFFTRQEGKLRKFYVRKNELESFRALVDLAVEEKKRARRTLQAEQQWLKKLRQSLRERNLLINSLKENSVR
jgi:hypothetical protein